MAKKDYRDLHEQNALIEAMPVAQIDRENGIVKDVVLLTGEKATKNNTFYTKKAITEAVSRYEGAKMFLDHGDTEVRSVKDLGGTYRNVRMQENKVVADLKLVNDDKVRNLVYHMAEEKVGGLSIRDRGRGREEKDLFMVEGFSKGNPFSIDLVTEPSANSNLLEHLEVENIDVDDKNKGGDDMKLSEAKLEDLQKENSALVEAIRAEERAKVLSEVDEKLKQGAEALKALVLAKKLTALAEAGFPTEVSKSVRKMIEAEAVSLEVAEGIISGQKEVLSAASKMSVGNPKVMGHGIDQDGAGNLNEDRKSDKISDGELIEALIGK